MILAGIIGGVFAGPALSCMHDAAFRALRDVKPRCLSDYRHAWRQNWRQSILPGVLFCLLLGFDLFMAMLFWWSPSFPGWGTITLYLFSILMITMWFSIAWPQIVLFDQPFRQNAVNCLLYNTLNDSFHIEEQIACAYPGQIPFYEDDETWLRRKQQEDHRATIHQE